MSFIWAHSFNVKRFYLPHSIRPYQELPLRVKADLGAMVMKRYSTFPKAPKLESYYQIVKCHIQGYSLGGLPSVWFDFVAHQTL